MVVVFVVTAGRGKQHLPWQEFVTLCRMWDWMAFHNHIPKMHRQDARFLKAGIQTVGIIYHCVVCQAAYL